MNTSKPGIPLKENSAVQIRAIQGEDRGLFYAPIDGKKIAKGTTILRLQPEVAVPVDAQLRQRCHACDKRVMKVVLQPCSDCKVVHYCSDACKIADEAVHKEECKHLIALHAKYSAFKTPVEGQTPVIPSTEVRMAARLLWLRRQKGQVWWEAIESLPIIPKRDREPAEEESYIDKERKDKDKRRDDELLLLALYLCGSSTDVEAKRAELGVSGLEDMEKLYDCLCQHLIEVPDVNLIPVAKVLSSTAAIINHSCVPNVQIVFPKGAGIKDCVQIVAVKDIKAGEELVCSYTDTSQPWIIRQVDLSKKNILLCECTLCIEGKELWESETEPKKVDPREAVWCGRPGCKGWVALNWQPSKPVGLCTNCKQPCILDQSKLEAPLKLGEAYLHEWDKTKSTRSHCSMLRDLEGMLKDLTAMQPPCSYPLMGLLTRSHELLGERFSMEKMMDHKEDMLYWAKVSYQATILTMAGYQAGKGDGLLCGGHLRRFLTLAYLIEVAIALSDGQAIVSWETASPSKYFSRLPDMPAPNPGSVSYFFTQFVQEIKIGFGEDAEENEEWYSQMAGHVKKYLSRHLHVPYETPISLVSSSEGGRITCLSMT